jgi:hypothetical protein
LPGQADDREHHSYLGAPAHLSASGPPDAKVFWFFFSKKNILPALSAAPHVKSKSLAKCVINENTIAAAPMLAACVGENPLCDIGRGRQVRKLRIEKEELLF